MAHMALMVMNGTAITKVVQPAICHATGPLRLIQPFQPIAWNPTGKGWKVEETLLTDPAGNHLLTGDSNWPQREVRGRIRPDLLRR